MAKSTKKNLEAKAKKLWTELALKKWGEKCEICGAKATQIHHYIPKGSNRLLKYDIENAVPLCQSCHYKIHFSPKPGEVARLVEIIRKKRGKKWCDYIDAKEKEKLGGFYGVNYLKGIVSDLEEQLERSQKNN